MQGVCLEQQQLERRKKSLRTMQQFEEREKVKLETRQYSRGVDYSVE